MPASPVIAVGFVAVSALSFLRSRTGIRRDYESIYSLGVAFTAYAASKGAVRQFTKTVAIDCARKGYKIRCNSVHPGMIDTPMTRIHGGDAAMSHVYGRIVLRNTSDVSCWIRGSR